MKCTEAQADLSLALSTAQRMIKGAEKTSSNPFFKTKYADLASCWEACKEALTSNGIAVVQGCGQHEHGVIIQTRLTHKSGQWIEDDGLFVPATKADAQGFGSALTYARRYGLCAMVGIAPEDDDGNAAAKSSKKPAPEPKPDLTPPMDTAPSTVDSLMAQIEKAGTQDDLRAVRPQVLAVHGPGRDMVADAYRARFNALGGK